MPSHPALIVLAAGASRRLGACKALVPFGESTALELLLASGRCMDGAPPLVVVGAHATQIAARLPKHCQLLVHEGWALGRTSSIQAGLMARPGLDVCLSPVDAPLVLARTYLALAQSWEEAGAPEHGWLAPYLQASAGAPRAYGHPVVLGRKLAAEGLKFAPQQPLRELRGSAGVLLGTAVDDPGILDQLDHPQDLERMRTRFFGG